MQIKPVRIIITTSTSELESDSILEDIAFSGEGVYASDADIKNDEAPIVFESDGIMTSDDGDIRVSYIEGLPDGGENHTVLSFRENCPTTVSMISGGMGPTALVFDSVKGRCNCIYNMGPFPFEVTICTEVMTNTINYNTGGKLFAEYTVEVHGVPAEFNRLTVRVEPVRSMKNNILDKYKNIQIADKSKENS